MRMGRPDFASEEILPRERMTGREQEVFSTSTFRVPKKTSTFRAPWWIAKTIVRARLWSTDIEVTMANSLDGEANGMEEAYLRQRQIQSPTEKTPLPPKTH